MRWWILALFILVLPAVSATAEWHWAGDTFKIGDNVYSVEGSYYDRVFFSANGRSWIIGLGECVKEGLSEYCYAKSAYPSDDAHIKYVAGEKLYGYYMDIKAVEPKLTVTRTQDVKTPKLGEKVEITVKLENKGDYPVTALVYDEVIPAGLEISSGPRSGNKIRFEKKNLGAGEIDVFSYTLTPVDYVNAQLIPNVSHKYEGASFTGKVTPISFTVETPLLVNRTMPATVNLGDQFVYTFNITNKGDDPMTALITIRLPESLRHLDAGSYNVSNRTYKAAITLKAKETQILTLKLYSTAAGNFKVPVDLNVTIRDTKFNRFYDEPVAIKADKLVPVIKLSSNRQSFAPGEKITIQGTVANVNDGVTFTKVNGVMGGNGLFTDVSFNHESFPPKKNITEAEVVVTLPEVQNTTVYNITLSGRYMTPAGSIYDFTTTKPITINPLVQAITITTAIDPKEPRPGTNVTVTVTGKNAYGKYATFSAFDTTDFERVSGLMFAETSLERDQTKTLYIYQLAIPADYDKAVFNITTQVKLKDEPNPVRSTVSVPIYGRVLKNDTVATNTSTNETGTDGTVVVTEQKGFFTRTWTKLKSWFS